MIPDRKMIMTLIIKPDFMFSFFLRKTYLGDKKKYFIGMFKWDHAFLFLEGHTLATWLHLSFLVLDDLSCSSDSSCSILADLFTFCTDCCSVYKQVFVQENFGFLILNTAFHRGHLKSKGTDIAVLSDSNHQTANWALQVPGSSQKHAVLIFLRALVKSGNLVSLICHR